MTTTTPINPIRTGSNRRHHVRGSVRTYALIRIAFGLATLGAPTATGRAIAGDTRSAAASAPLAKAFLRGMGGREIGLGLGVLHAGRASQTVRPWLLVGALADALDTVALAAATWRDTTPAMRAAVLGVPAAFAAAAAALAAKE